MEDGRHYLDIFRTCSHSHQIKGRIKEEYEGHKEKWQELVCLFTAIMQAVSVTYTLQLCEVRAYFINKTTQKKMCGVLLSWTLILTCRLCTNDRCSGISEVRSCLIWKKQQQKNNWASAEGSITFSRTPMPYWYLSWPLQNVKATF